jgi:hypothetical protein
MTSMRSRGVGLALVVAGAAALAGCGRKSFMVQAHPTFYTPELKVVAVAPFDNQTPQFGAGETVADRLAAALRANGTYKVLGPTELRGLLGESGAGSATQPARVDLLDRLKQVGGVDAVVTGTVMVYDAVMSGYTEWSYGGGFARRSGWGWRAGYSVPHTSYATQADVAFDAVVWRVADGSVLARTPVPVHAAVAVEDYLPRSARQVLLEAVDRAAMRLVPQIAVVWVKVRARDKDLRIAADRVAGEWEFTKTVGLNEPKMYVVVHLPPEADRNAFTVTITHDKHPERVLAVKSLVWSRKDASQGLEFSPAEIASQHGPGKYQANLYSQRGFILDREFKIK